MTKLKNTRCVRPQKLLNAHTTNRIYVGSVHAPDKKKKKKILNLSPEVERNLQDIEEENNLSKYSIVSAVTESLRLSKKDYCYRKKDEKEILQYIEENKLTVAWSRHYNKYNEYEYTVFYPVKYKKLEGDVYTPVRHVCYELNKIPKNFECKFVEDKKYYTLKKACKE